MSRHRIERQNGLLPPSRFLRTSERTGIVHRLPGRMHKANPKIKKPSLRLLPYLVSTRYVHALLGPCFKTGQINQRALLISYQILSYLPSFRNTYPLSEFTYI